MYPHLHTLSIEDISVSKRSDGRLYFYLRIVTKQLLSLKLDYDVSRFPPSVPSVHCSKLFRSSNCTLKSLSIQYRPMRLSHLYQLEHLNIQLKNEDDLHFLLLRGLPEVKTLKVRLFLWYAESRAVSVTTSSGCTVSPYLKQFDLHINSSIINYRALESLILEFSQSLEVLTLKLDMCVNDPTVVDGQRLGESADHKRMFFFRQLL
jgi:hypothetical protein